MLICCMLLDSHAKWQALESLGYSQYGLTGGPLGLKVSPNGYPLSGHNGSTPEIAIQKHCKEDEAAGAANRITVLQS